jgi:hypothetical protein
LFIPLVTVGTVISGNELTYVALLSTEVSNAVAADVAFACVNTYPARGLLSVYVLGQSMRILYDRPTTRPPPRWSVPFHQPSVLLLEKKYSPFALVIAVPT